MKIERDLGSKTSRELDLLAACVSSVLPRSFLQDLVIQDRVVFSDAIRVPFALPQLQMGTPTLSLTRSDQSLRIPKLQRRLAALQRAARQKRYQLDSVFKWRLSALVERDRWKQFDWAFLALEILTQVMSKHLYKQVTARLRFGNRGGDPIGDLVWSKERLPLRSKFAIMALALSADTAAQDVRTFSAVKKARDEMSHGNITSADALPIGPVLELLDKYFDAAFGLTLTQ
jgi:hypothetical protein